MAWMFWLWHIRWPRIWNYIKILIPHALNFQLPDGVMRIFR
ncbi:hypothetical protein GA0115233_103056 [Streptomyces sp. DI166]|nr:hypothetical protein GA0115233_103056 [Streptomyces sp. DI166]